MASPTLSWNDRFAILDEFKVSDKEACSAFGVTQDNLDVARQMLKAGTFKQSKNIDVKSYQGLFKTVQDLDNTKQTTEVQPTTPAAAPSTDTTAPPHKKRGRKGDKIALAFKQVPSAPVDVNDFMKKHSVSLAVLRQSKRFDSVPELGRVRVKKDKQSGALMIWREAIS